MSQIRKKDKSLYRKRNAKHDSNQEELKKNTLKEDSSKIFSTGFSLSIKHEENEDNSILSVDTPLKYGSCSNRCNSDEIKLFNNTKICLENECISKEVHPGNETTTKSIFDEETVVGDTSVDVFKFPDEDTSVFDDSSTVFKNDSGNEENKLIPSIKTNKINDYRLNIQIDHSTLSDDDVSIPYPLRNESNSIEDKNTVDETEKSESNTFQQCPICFKTTTKYINHMKSCAVKSHLTTRQLLSILKLHKKQLAERKELGLGPPVPSFRAKVSPKRTKTVDKKVPIDSNLQLALALSASLQSAEENEVIQEAEALKEAGLSEEADKKLSTLENYGFASELPSLSRNVKGIFSSKRRLLAPTLLLKRTKEERERIVTEKVAIVLISDEESAVLNPFAERRPIIKSKKLLKCCTEDCVLWDKAHCPIEEQRGAFYIQTLSKFIEPSTAEVGEGLKRLSQVPGRLNTPVRDNISDLHLSPPLQAFSGIKKALSSASTVRRYSITPDKTNKLSEDWRKLVDNSFLSDVCVQCNNGEMIPAHKLVLYVRCPAILNEAVRQESGKDKIILDDHSRRSVITFLDFVYSGNSDKMQFLSSEELQSLISLTEKYNYAEMKNKLLFVNKTRGSQQKKFGKKHVNKELFGDLSDAQDDEGDANVKISSVARDVSTECSYANLNLEIHSHNSDFNSLDCLSSCNRKGSPDMFGDSDVLDSKSCSPEKDDLAMLASLVGETCSQVDNERDKNMSYPFDDVDFTNTLSLSGSASVKRKTLSSSLSEDEDAVQYKKVCTDLSHSVISEDTNGDKSIVDLTQSSSSSKEELATKNEPELGEESDDCKIVSPTRVLLDESLEELTQQNPSSPTCTEKLSKTRDLADSFNNDCPVWDGFEDDCWYYNYEINTPMKNSSLQNCSLTKSENKSPKISLEIQYKSKSSDKNSQKIPSPLSSVSSLRMTSPIKHRSSEKTPDVYLTKYSDNFEEENSVLHSSDSKETNHCPKDNSNHFKTRKNLSFQFDTGINLEHSREESSSKLVTESQKESSPFQIIPLSPEEEESKCVKKSYKKSSLAVMQRLLDDSFEINESKLLSIDALASTPGTSCIGDDNVSDVCPSKSFKTDINHEKQTVMTPSPEIYVSDNVTPLPNYSSMKTPALKKELKRFGLKPSLGKGKAKLLLRHIYNQTHPFIDEPIEVRDEFKQPEGQPPRSPTKIIQNNLTTVDLVDSDTEEPCSQTSTCSSMSSVATLPEESLFESEEDLLTQAPNSDGDVRTSVRNLILNDPDLHHRILMYEPIFVEDLMAMLKSKGIKSKSNQIIEFLDEQCITFRTTSWKTRNEKRRQKQKSPKKKTNSTSSGEHSRSAGLSPKKHESPKKNKIIGRPSKISKKL